MSRPAAAAVAAVDPLRELAAWIRAEIQDEEEWRTRERRRLDSSAVAVSLAKVGTLRAVLSQLDEAYE